MYVFGKSMYHVFAKSIYHAVTVSFIDIYSMHLIYPHTVTISRFLSKNFFCPILIDHTYPIFTITHPFILLLNPLID